MTQCPDLLSASILNFQEWHIYRTAYAMVIGGPKLQYTLFGVGHLFYIL
jgi:hypothetical protein